LSGVLWRLKQLQKHKMILARMSLWGVFSLSNVELDKADVDYRFDDPPGNKRSL
jgi:hypothetical protein